MAAFFAGWIGIITAIATGALPLFIAATIVAGAGQGIAISGTTRSLADRAPIFAVVYLLSYSGATIPSLITGQLANAFSLPKIALGYGAFALVATLFTVIAARNPHTDTTSQHDECSRQISPSP
jgi:hypothetical protein